MLAITASRMWVKQAYRVLSLFGGDSKHEQWKKILAGVEAVIATPGRLIDMVRKGAFNLGSRCTFVVVDEADVMFNMGFEYQIRMVLGQVRPERQALLFSATFPQKIQKLVTDKLHNPLKIIVGKLGNANEDVTQKAIIFDDPGAKLSWAIRNVPELMREGQLLIFANQIKAVEELANVLCGLYPDDSMTYAKVN
jgi:ATP-dependent RNA helicase DDX42